MEKTFPFYEQNEISKLNTRLTDCDDQTLHAHEFVEIFYVVSGSILHLIGGETYELSAGHLAIVFPHTPHRFLRSGNCTHRDFIIHKSLAKETFNFIDESAYERFKNAKYAHCKVTTDDVTFIEISTKRFYEELDVNKRRNYEKVLVSTLLGLLYLYSNKYTNLNDFKSKCEFLISNSYTLKNTVDIIRNELGYNKYYLCRKFKETFGETLVDHINKLKLNYAAYLLKTTNYNVSEICEQIGIESLPYFIKLFTKKYGLTPAKYRKQNQNLSVESSPSPKPHHDTDNGEI